MEFMSAKQVSGVRPIGSDRFNREIPKYADESLRLHF